MGLIRRKRERQRPRAARTLEAYADDIQQRREVMKTGHRLAVQHQELGAKLKDLEAREVELQRDLALGKDGVTEEGTVEVRTEIERLKPKLRGIELAMTTNRTEEITTGRAMQELGAVLQTRDLPEDHREQGQALQAQVEELLVAIEQSERAWRDPLADQLSGLDLRAHDGSSLEDYVRRSSLVEQIRRAVAAACDAPVPREGVALPIPNGRARAGGSAFAQRLRQIVRERGLA